MTDVPAVAIVGMSGRFPGARDLGEFWANLRGSVCSITDFTEEELLAAGVDAAELRGPGYVASKGFLTEADRFEHELFAFNATEAAALDPQHRQLLETAWSALEDAGYDPRRPPPRTGVYVGGGPSEHSVAAQVDGRLRTRLGAMHVRVFTDREFLAGWLSYRLGMNGPSMTVQTGCSTSLTTVHVAVQALLVGECDLALAGGVSIDSPYPRGYSYEPGGISSPDGRCRPFDEKAAGTVGGNGVGLVVLRRLEDAVADGDPIYAVIRGTAATNDGPGRVGFTAPGVDGQVAAIVEAWAAADLDPADAQYLEAHGTGTDLGDRIEVSAAAAAFEGTDATGAGRCAIGSVKSNVGHLNASAGIVGLIKAALMLRHRTMVPTVNVTRPHPDLALDTTPFRLLTTTEQWPRPASGLRLAGVSSLGIGGTNVHVVLSEAPEPSRVSGQAQDALPLPLSARTEAQLAAACARLAAALRTPGAPPLADVAHTLAHGRTALEIRACVVARTHEEAATALEALATGSAPDPAQPTGRETTRATAPAQPSRLGAAWVAGQEVVWPRTGGRRAQLPTYPFAGEHHGALTLGTPPAPQNPAPQNPAPQDLASHDPASQNPGPQDGDLTVAVTELFTATLALSGPEDLSRTYFAVGGDSLTAVFLVSELRDRFALEVPVELFLTELPLRDLISRAVHGEDDDLLNDLLDELE
ncbi:beta-ketoacyl synthase N-terminal-like domain-containing protein [Nonomuraea sp. NPDC050404]|uniref:beta-ketoacyl synthase N-terminal-like domain-containing protein n=1 Tax=Nonomuraea sp. NPDC050404 TaxID=3155783 RepID=UPI0033C080D0